METLTEVFYYASTVQFSPDKMKSFRNRREMSKPNITFLNTASTHMAEPPRQMKHFGILQLIQARKWTLDGASFRFFH